MKNPVRITIALDEDTSKLFDTLKAETKLSQSELLRKALRFYSENKEALDSPKAKKIKTYLDMLGEGEHIILDVDHWLFFMKLAEGDKDFWEAHKRIAQSHAEQFNSKKMTAKELLERLESCNFYKLGRASENEYTLVLGSPANKRFIKTFLEEVAPKLGFRLEIKEDIAKLRVKILK